MGDNDRITKEQDKNWTLKHDRYVVTEEMLGRLISASIIIVRTFFQI
jgi:hypothetical protein